MSIMTYCEQCYEYQSLCETFGVEKQHENMDRVHYRELLERRDNRQKAISNANQS